MDVCTLFHLHLPPLRFHCVGGCWDLNPGQLRLRHWLSDALATRLHPSHHFWKDTITKGSACGCCCSCLKTSASLRRAVLMSTGKGYFSSSLGNRTMASLCSPIRGDRSPENEKIFRFFLPVLRIRIRNPMPFWSLDPEFGMGKNEHPGS